MRENNWAGFGHIYLKRCDKESKEGDKIDVEVYSKLVELDERLGGQPVQVRVKEGREPAHFLAIFGGL